MANKIRYGISKCYYAVITETTASDGSISVSYGTPVALPGAVSLSMDASGDSNIFYADNLAYFSQYANNGYEAELEIAQIPESFETDILGQTKDSTTGILLEKNTDTAKNFALLFQFEGDVNATRHVLYYCSASRPSLEANTVEDSIEPATDTINIVAGTNPATNATKGKCDATASAYANWFTAVQEVTSK